MSEYKRSLPSVIAIKHGDYGLTDLSRVVRVLRTIRVQYHDFGKGPRARPSGMNNVRFKPSLV